MIIHISGKHGIVGGNRFIKANTVSAYQFCGNHLSPRHVITVFQDFKIHVLRYFLITGLTRRKRNQRVRVRRFRTKRNQVVIRIPVNIQHVQKTRQEKIISVREYQPSAFGAGKSAITGIARSPALFGKENLHIRSVLTGKMSKVHNIRRTVIIYHDNLHIIPWRNGVQAPLQQTRYVFMRNNNRIYNFHFFLP